mmetsp:Transcript_58977/g.175383  ORF Transcript_58977/g.175383 Transcript_58977/m.175383 type:complete len:129 (-) Transcript_58977:86-472(-)
MMHGSSPFDEKGVMYLVGCLRSSFRNEVAGCKRERFEHADNSQVQDRGSRPESKSGEDMTLGWNNLWYGRLKENKIYASISAQLPCNCFGSMLFLRMLALATIRRKLATSCAVLFEAEIEMQSRRHSR